MEYKDIPIEQMKDDEEFKSKRNQLTIISILLMAMSLSNAQIKEANTFIFKIEFSNSPAFGWLVFLGVIVLTVRYYSFAFKYHRQLYKMWSEDMIKDHRLLVYYNDQDHSGLSVPHGLLSKMKGEEYSKSLEQHEYDTQQLRLKYKTSYFLKRSLNYDVDVGEYFQVIEVDLNKYDDNWTKGDFRKLLKIELEYRLNAFFRRAEYLGILLPYIIAFVAMLSFMFKSKILEFLL